MPSQARLDLNARLADVEELINAHRLITGGRVGRPAQRQGAAVTLVHAVEAGRLAREDVTALGAVLAGETEGRRSNDEATVFDSTGLAIQDLAVALAAVERADELSGLGHVEL